MWLNRWLHNKYGTFNSEDDWEQDGSSSERGDHMVIINRSGSTENGNENDNWEKRNWG